MRIKTVLASVMLAMATLGYLQPRYLPDHPGIGAGAALLAAALLVLTLVVRPRMDD